MHINNSAIKMRKKQFLTGIHNFLLLLCCALCFRAPSSLVWGVFFRARRAVKKFELSIQLVLHVNVFRYFVFSYGKCVSWDGFSPCDLDKKMIGMRDDGVGSNDAPFVSFVCWGNLRILSNFLFGNR